MTDGRLDACPTKLGRGSRPLVHPPAARMQHLHIFFVLRGRSTLFGTKVTQGCLCLALVLRERAARFVRTARTA